MYVHNLMSRMNHIYENTSSRIIITCRSAPFCIIVEYNNTSFCSTRCVHNYMYLYAYSSIRIFSPEIKTHSCRYTIENTVFLDNEKYMSYRYVYGNNYSLKTRLHGSAYYEKKRQVKAIMSKQRCNYKQ